MLERLNQAMEYVEAHLDQRVEVSELARITVTSEYHFRRLFSSPAGMPLSEYVRRRRLTVAGVAVLAGEPTLLEIAVQIPSNPYEYRPGPEILRTRPHPGEPEHSDAQLWIPVTRTTA